MFTFIWSQAAHVGVTSQWTKLAKVVISDIKKVRVWIAVLTYHLMPYLVSFTLTSVAVVFAKAWSQNILSMPL
jgi:hypothetical protein